MHKPKPTEQFIKTFVYSLTKTDPDGQKHLRTYVTVPHRLNVVIQSWKISDTWTSYGGDSFVSKEEARKDWEDSINNGYTPLVDDKGNLIVKNDIHGMFTTNTITVRSDVETQFHRMMDMVKLQHDNYISKPNFDSDITSYALNA